jgi:hypothetical protein
MAYSRKRKRTYKPRAYTRKRYASKKKPYYKRKRVTFRKKKYTSTKYRRKKSRRSAMPMLSNVASILDPSLTLDQSRKVFGNSFNLLPNNKWFRCPFVHSMVRGPDGSGLPTYHMYRMNSIYDPDASDTFGKQPLWHDQLAVYYNNYMVTSATVTATFRWATNATNTKPNYLVAVIPSNVPSLPYASTSDLQEVYPSQCRILESNESHSVSISLKFNARQFFNLENTADNQAALAATFNANPMLAAYALITIAVCDGYTYSSGDAMPKIHVHTKITYNTKCFLPKSPTTSLDSIPEGEEPPEEHMDSTFVMAETPIQVAEAHLAYLKLNQE